MSKKKKIIISAIAVFCALVIAAGAIIAVKITTKDDIDFAVRDTLPEGEGKKAHVILLAGQSNAAGCSLDSYLKKNVSATKYDEYSAGYDNVYINYYVTGTNESREFVKCRNLQGEGGGYFGPELGLAEKLSEQYPDELFFIIKCTWSGTALYHQWISPSSVGKTGYLYRQFVRYVDMNLQYLKSKNYDVSLEGMCWMQGESDCFDINAAKKYASNLNNFIEDLRERYAKYASDDGIAFIDAYIADNPVFWVYCDIVNSCKQEVADSSPINVVVDTVSEGLSCSAEPEENPDMAHYDSLSEIKLGHLFAKEIIEFLDK